MNVKDHRALVPMLNKYEREVTEVWCPFCLEKVGETTYYSSPLDQTPDKDTEKRIWKIIKGHECQEQKGSCV